MAFVSKIKGQSVLQVIGSIIDSFLGPNKSNKVIFDGTNSHIIQCPLSLFENVHLQDPLSQVIEETLYTHHETYQCSTTTLLSMWYYWSNEFQSLMDVEDYEIAKVTDVVLRALDYVISSLHTIEIPMRTILSEIIEVISEHNSFSLCNQNNGKNTHYAVEERKKVIATNKSMTKIPQGILYSSRHYSPFQSHLEESDAKSLQKESINRNACFNPQTENRKIEIVDKAISFSAQTTHHIHCVAKCLMHDESVLADVISEMWIQQIVLTRCTKFSTSNLSVCPVVMASTHTRLISGLAWKTQTNDFCWLNSSRPTTDCNVLVIKGDLTKDYVHLGFSPKVHLKCIKENEQIMESENELWLRKCFEQLIKVNAGILLIRGKTDPSIISFCSTHIISVFTGVPWNILKTLCKSYNISPATHLTECDSNNIIKGIRVEKLEIEPACTQSEDHYFKIEAAQMRSCHTVILCHPSPEVLNLREHRFWHAASRLALASEAQAVLPGEGLTEKWCCQALEEWAVDQRYESNIILAVAKGFMLYSSKVSKNIELGSPLTSHPYDEMKSKVQAWRSAMSLLLTTIQCDAIIVNGTDESTLEDYNTSIHLGIL